MDIAKGKNKSRKIYAGDYGQDSGIFRRTLCCSSNQFAALRNLMRVEAEKLEKDDLLSDRDAKYILSKLEQSRWKRWQDLSGKIRSCGF